MTILPSRFTAPRSSFIATRRVSPLPPSQVQPLPAARAAAISSKLMVSRGIADTRCAYARVAAKGAISVMPISPNRTVFARIIAPFSRLSSVPRRGSKINCHLVIDRLLQFLPDACVTRRIHQCSRSHLAPVWMFELCSCGGTVRCPHGGGAIASVKDVTS